MSDFNLANFNALGDLLGNGSNVPLMIAPTAPSPRAACYARFSSDLQSTDSLDQQQRACRDAAERNGHQIPSDLQFSDEAVSGTKLIAVELETTRNRVKKLLNLAAVRHGEQLEDGRARQGRLKVQRGPRPKHELIADDVMALVHQRLLLLEIAERLGTHRDMITAAVRYWHTSRGLPVPDGRTRRKELERKNSRGRREQEPPQAA